MKQAFRVTVRPPVLSLLRNYLERPPILPPPEEPLRAGAEELPPRGAELTDVLRCGAEPTDVLRCGAELADGIEPNDVLRCGAEPEKLRVDADPTERVEEVLPIRPWLLAGR